MNTLTTNIIRNVYNIGTNACDNGPSYCSDGYALYFPCLKDITKGQDVCFDFYVADYAGRNEYLLNAANTGDGTNPDGTDGTGDNGSGKELADLRDVDALSLNLIGMFNCPYGTFSYPDNISSLQTEDYPVMYREDFGERHLCHLDVIKIDTENDASDLGEGKSGDFYSGTEVRLKAEDTPTHIFIGWAILDIEAEDCPDDTWDDYIKSSNRDYSFIIETDLTIFALYRPRKVYTVVSNPANMSSLFVVDYNHISKKLSNRGDEIYDTIEDEYPYLSSVDQYDGVLEGYHMVVTCVPCVESIGSTRMAFKFIRWEDKDSSVPRLRVFTVGVDTKAFEHGDTISLKARCQGPFANYTEPGVDEVFYQDDFDEDGIHILNLEEEMDDSEIFLTYYGGEHVISFDNVLQQYIEETGYLYFNNGTLVLTSLDVEDGIKVNIHAKAYNEDDDCDLTVSVNGYDAKVSLAKDEFKQYEFLFRKCDKQNIIITTDGECLVDMVEVCKEEIIDKGKAQLCLPSEVTENLPSGTLSVNGAIMVNGQSYGLATTQIGTVNKLPKITIN